jgi:uncharacterized protein YdeI (YjbR/CyaY-like superfamily)
MEQYDKRVDLYIAKSADFAKPVLSHIRQLVHVASPLITETIKWNCPIFDYKGIICYMASFKQHCAFGLWKHTLIEDHEKLLIADGSRGSFGRIKALSDLLGDEKIIGFIRQAVNLNELGTKTLTKKSKTGSDSILEIPDYLIDILADFPEAKTAFYKLSQAHQREYVEWMVEAKSDTVLQKRIETALEWIISGKPKFKNI